MSHSVNFPRLVVFDLDGTLIDSRIEIELAVNRIRREYGLFELPSAEIEPLIGMPPSHFFADLTRLSEIDEAVRGFRTSLRENLGTFTQPMNGSLELVEFLKIRDIDTAIATTKPTFLAKAAIAACGIHVDFTQGTDDFEPKPNPEVVVRCMRQFSRKGVETLMVGDRAQDVLAGRAAGCTTVGIKNDPTSKDDFERIKPDYTFQSLEGVHRWIEERLL